MAARPRRRQQRRRPALTPIPASRAKRCSSIFRERAEHRAASSASITRSTCRASARTPITIPAMASSEPGLTVKQSLTPSELDDAGALVREARWNQLPADWRIFLALGRLYAAQLDEGRIVATTATLPYG